MKRRLRRILSWLILAIGAIVVVGALGLVLILRALVLPDEDEFGNVLDEPMRAELTRDDFRAADDDYLVDMDKGLLREPPTEDGRKVYPGSIVRVAELTGLSPEEVRQHAIRGQNTWNVWTGGNDRFWDYLAGITAGGFDLLKVISSYAPKDSNPPDDGSPGYGSSGYGSSDGGPPRYGRHNRWHYLGLVNEPCFEQATSENVDDDLSEGWPSFGLWIDRRKEGCEPDPYENEDEETGYPGVKIDSRGKTLRLDAYTGAEVTMPVGSYYGKATGVMGLRLFPNPDFGEDEAERWDPERYYTDPDYYLDGDLVRPYRVGMSCGFCHVGPSPVNSPPNPEAPAFEHLASNPGAQYFWVDRIFVWNTRPRTRPDRPAPNEHNIIYQLFHTNPPGALDTSLVSTDYMNNPRTMNAVYSVVARLKPTLRWGKETLTGDERDNKQFQDYEQTKALGGFWDDTSGAIHTARVLKDGADSVGVLGALNRVYLNIGLFSEEWILHFRPVIGGQKISPIRIRDAVENSAYWGATEDMTADMALFFLATATPDRLEDFPAGRRHLPTDPEQVERGKVVFAENCAACHSSKIPEPPAESGVETGICADGGNGAQYRECWDRYWAWVQTDEFKAAMREMVLDPNFPNDNFLSTERRVPVDLLETNACNPIASNALEGDIWDNFSSTTYKELPPVGELTVHHPVSGGEASFQPFGNGRGYTRPASLVSLWSTAPFLQNNSVGHEDTTVYNGGGYGGGQAGGYSYGTAYESEVRCPAPSDADPYLPCVDNRMRVFHESIHKLLNPDTRRRDELLGERVPGYIYRTTAPSCAIVPKGYLPDVFGAFPGFFNWVADWAFEEDGSLTLGPLPAGFPINTLLNTKLLPDNDEPDMLAHYMRMARAAPTLLRAFRQLGGTCSPEELNEPATQERAERVVRETGLIDALVGLSKCPDYVVNRGHYFGSELPSRDKEALIEYLKLL